jgi:transposase
MFSQKKEETVKGRKAKLPEALFEHDFKILAKKEPHARTRIRLLILAHIKEGKSITEVSNDFKISRVTVHFWLRRLNSEGINGLKEKEGRGANLKLSADKHKAFKQAVLALQHNRNGGRIRGEDVLKLMKEKFGVNCSIDTVYRTLSRVKLVWITGRSMHPKANLEAQEAFKKTSKKS